MSLTRLEDLDKDTLLFAAHRAHLRAAIMHTEVHKTRTQLERTHGDEVPEVAVSLAKKIGAYRELESLANALQTMAIHLEEPEEHHGKQ